MHAREKTEIPGKGKGTSTSELLSPVLGQKLSRRATVPAARPSYCMHAYRRRQDLQTLPEKG